MVVKDHSISKVNGWLVGGDLKDVLREKGRRQSGERKHRGTSENRDSLPSQRHSPRKS